MKVETKLTELGLAVPDLESLYRTNASGAHYISHYPVQNLLYLSGTTPRRDGRGYLPGVVGQDLTLEQGYEAARYAAVPAYGANFARMGLKPVETAIAAQTPDAVQRGLAQWHGVVDHIIIRAITAKDTVEEHLALVRAAAPA